MHLKHLLEALESDRTPDAEVNVTIISNRVLNAGFVKWEPDNRADDDIFSNVLYFKSPVYMDTTSEHDDDRFITYIELEVYPIRRGGYECVYKIEMGTQSHTPYFDDFVEKDRSIQLGSSKEATKLNNRTVDPSIALKCVTSMLELYKKNIESKFKKEE